MLTKEDEDHIRQNFNSWSEHALRDCIKDLLTEVNRLQDEVSSLSHATSRIGNKWESHSTKGWVKK